MNDWWEGFLSLLFPPRCYGCGRGVEQRGQWCEICMRELWHPRRIPLHAGMSSLYTCTALCLYDKGVRKALRAVKFHGQKSVAPHLIWLLEQHVLTEEYDWIVPVPLSAVREAQRGYNQTELLFALWSKAQGRWQPLLQRSKETHPQWRLTLAERKANVKNAFQLKTDMTLQGTRILLVDDIYTTGATMQECAKVLLQAGAQRVSGLAMASRYV